MNNKEHEDLLDSIFPVGKERWIKIMIKDRDACLKAFKWNREDSSDGYIVTAIGTRDEYVPQVSAIKDLEDDIIALLMRANLQDYQLNEIQNIFKQKKDELKDRVILTNQ